MSTMAGSLWGSSVPATQRTSWHAVVRAPEGDRSADSVSERVTPAGATYEDASSERPYSALVIAAGRINALGALESDWDSYGGLPVDRFAAVKALGITNEMLLSGADLPAFVPGSDGSVQLEWRQGDVYAEIRIVPGGQMEVFGEDPQRNVQRDEVLSQEAGFPPQLRTWLAALLRS